MGYIALYRRNLLSLACISWVIAWVFTGCADQSSSRAEVVSSGASAASSGAVEIPVFELPAPENEQVRRYLGVPEGKTFTIADIQAPIILIEVFSMYCPHCQKEAPQVNELYQRIQASPELKDTIKIIGIGVGNSPLEVNLFREQYAVPFPLFSDENSEISKSLGVRATPTFIGVKKFSDGKLQVFHFKSGHLGDTSDFLALFMKESEFEEENK